MVGIEKRYYTVIEIAYRNDMFPESVYKYLDAFNFKVHKKNGKKAIEKKDYYHFLKCLELRKKSNMKMSYIKTVPQYIIKDLADRL